MLRYKTAYAMYKFSDTITSNSEKIPAEKLLETDQLFVADGDLTHVKSIMLYAGGYFHLETSISLSTTYYRTYRTDSDEITLSIGGIDQ